MFATAAHRRALITLLVAAIAVFGLLQAVPARAVTGPKPHPGAAASKASKVLTPAAATPITPGTPFTVSIPADNTPQLFSFPGVAGKHVTITTSGETSFSIWAPATSGTGLTSGDVSDFGELGLLATGGSITLQATSSVPVATTFTATVTLVSDLTGPLGFGAPLSPSIGTPGQNARYTFSATKGQRLAVEVSAFHLTSQDVDIFPVAFTLTRPDGSIAPGLTTGPDGVTPIIGAAVLSADLDTTGTWTMTVDPPVDATGTLTFTAIHPADTIIAATPGQARAVSYPGDGSDVRLTFQAVVGQRVVLGVSASSLTDRLDDLGAPTVQVTLMRPDGTTASVLRGSDGLDLQAPSLIEDAGHGLVNIAGTWTLRLHPLGSTAGTQTVKLGLVTDQSAAAKLGSATAVRISTPGQQAHYSLTGSAGETVVITLDSGSWKSGTDGDPTGQGSAEVWLVNGSGTWSHPVSSDGTFFEAVLPTAGTYTVVVDPVGDSVGTATLTIRQPTATTAALTLDHPTTVKIGRGNQARFTFTGTQGRLLGVQVTSAAWVTGDEVAVQVLRPDGSDFHASEIFAPDYVETPALDTGGTWTVVIGSASGSSGTFTFTARQPIDQTGSLSVGQSSTATISTPGQAYRYTFHGLAGRRPTLDVSASTWTASNPENDVADVTLYRPDGSTFASFNPFPYPNQPGSGFSATNGVIDVSGTWTLVIDPEGDATGSQTFTLSEVQDVTGSITLGTAKSIHLPTKGQQGHFTFTWDGQGTLGLAYQDSTITSGLFAVTDPNGEELSGQGGINAGSDTGLFLGSGQAGTYTLTVLLSEYYTGSLTVTLNPVTGSDHKSAATPAIGPNLTRKS